MSYIGTKANYAVSLRLYSVQCRDLLKSAYDELIHVDIIDSNDPDHLELLGRPELGMTLTKLHCWRLTQYTKCVFLDADTLVCNSLSPSIRFITLTLDS